jgi:hypothetical protein
LEIGLEGSGAVFSFGGFRAPTFSLSVARGDAASEDEFELFMQLMGTCVDPTEAIVLNVGWRILERRRCVHGRIDSARTEIDHH